jgi:PKD repeat protein
MDNSWDLGDGTLTDVTELTHEYFDIGPKTVELIIANQVGCRDTVRRTVDVFGQPLASFTPSVLQGCERQPIVFSNNSIEANRYVWNIQGREPIEETSPTLTFEQQGNYTVQLIAIYNEFVRTPLSWTYPWRSTNPP